MKKITNKKIKRKSDKAKLFALLKKMGAELYIPDVRQTSIEPMPRLEECEVTLSIGCMAQTLRFWKNGRLVQKA